MEFQKRNTNSMSPEELASYQKEKRLWREQRRVEMEEQRLKAKYEELDKLMKEERS